MSQKDPLQGHTYETPRTLEDAIREIRFMCEAYRVVAGQRDAARANEKILAMRVQNLKDTLQNYIGKKS